MKSWSTSQNTYDCFLSSRGDDRELALAALYEEHGIGCVSSGEDDLLAPMVPRRLPARHQLESKGARRRPKSQVGATRDAPA